MMYLIIKEIDYENLDNTYRVVDHTDDPDKANDMLQGYRLIEKDKTIDYKMLEYEVTGKPLLLSEAVVTGPN